MIVFLWYNFLFEQINHMRTHTNRRTWPAPIVPEMQQTSSQVLRFEGAKYIFRGQDFCIYFMFETNFSGCNKIWGVQKFVGHYPRNPPCLGAWSAGCQIVEVLAFLIDASAKLKRRHVKRYAFALSVSGASRWRLCPGPSVHLIRPWLRPCLGPPTLLRASTLQSI